MNLTWIQHWIAMAQFTATKSKDQSTKVGAIVVDDHNSVVASGFNGFPRKIDDNNPEYHKRPLKYNYTEHAERNAIYQAAAGRGGTRGTTLYMNFEPAPCSACARAIIQAGIKRVVGPNIPFPGKGEQWKEDCRIAEHMLKEAEVQMVVVMGYDHGSN